MMNHFSFASFTILLTKKIRSGSYCRIKIRRNIILSKLDLAHSFLQIQYSGISLQQQNAQVPITRCSVSEVDIFRNFKFGDIAFDVLTPSPIAQPRNGSGCLRTGPFLQASNERCKCPKSCAFCTTAYEMFRRYKRPSFVALTLVNEAE